MLTLGWMGFPIFFEVFILVLSLSLNLSEINLQHIIIYIFNTTNALEFNNVAPNDCLVSHQFYIIVAAHYTPQYSIIIKLLLCIQCSVCVNFCMGATSKRRQAIILYIVECAGWHNWCSSPLICTIFEWT